MTAPVALLRQMDPIPDPGAELQMDYIPWDMNIIGGRVAKAKDLCMKHASSTASVGKRNDRGIPGDWATLRLDFGYAQVRTQPDEDESSLHAPSVLTFSSPATSSDSRRVRQVGNESFHSTRTSPAMSSSTGNSASDAWPGDALVWAWQSQPQLVQRVQRELASYIPQAPAAPVPASPLLERSRKKGAKRKQKACVQCKERKIKCSRSRPSCQSELDLHNLSREYMLTFATRLSA